MTGRRGTPEERFWRHVDVGSDGECWLWTANKNKGHGRFRPSAEAGPVQAHRFAYELLIGQIPEGLDVDHECHNRDDSCEGGNDCPHRACVNPAHLRAVTRRKNLLAGKGLPAIEARATHCPQGHPYLGDNLYIWRGERKCKTCRLAANRAWYARKAG